MHFWIKRLTPVLLAFYEQHKNHAFMLYDVQFDYPWEPEYEGYCEWKDADPENNELYLPRNLVDDLNITSWRDTEAHLKSNTVMLYDELELNEWQIKFNELVKIKSNAIIL